MAKIVPLRIIDFCHPVVASIAKEMDRESEAGSQAASMWSLVGSSLHVPPNTVKFNVPSSADP